MVYWHAKAKELLDRGYSYSQIGRVVGRTTGRVHHVLNGTLTPPKPDRVRGPDSELTQWRRAQRLKCRRIAAANTGLNLQKLYEKHGCADKDRAVIWDDRNGN